MYNYNHLYYFYVTAKSGSVSAAAKHLKISQPSLSSQIHVLERALGRSLFRRVGRHNHLTQVGATVYGVCRKMFELAEEMGEALCDRSPTRARRLEIGVTPEIDRPFVTEIIGRFLKQYPIEARPRVVVSPGNHLQLAERLRFRELDAVITPLPLIESDFQNIGTAEIPVVLVAPAGRRVLRKTAVGPLQSVVQSLAPPQCETQWVMPSGAYQLRAETDQCLGALGISGRVVFESDVISSLVRAIREDWGLGLLPRVYLAREIREKTVSVFAPPEGYWRYRLWLTCHMQGREDALVMSLAQAFEAVIRDALRASG